MQTCFGIEVLAGEAQIDRGAARRRLLPEGSAVPAPDRAAPRVRGIAGGQQMVRVQIENALRPAGLVDLRQRFAVDVDIFADQGTGVIVFPDQHPAKEVASKKQMNDLQERIKNILRLSLTINPKTSNF